MLQLESSKDKLIGFHWHHIKTYKFVFIFANKVMSEANIHRHRKILLKAVDKRQPKAQAELADLQFFLWTRWYPNENLVACLPLPQSVSHRSSFNITRGLSMSGPSLSDVYKFVTVEEYFHDIKSWQTLKKVSSLQFNDKEQTLVLTAMPLCGQVTTLQPGISWKWT